MEHEHLIAMLNRLKLTAIRDQLDGLIDEAGRARADHSRGPVAVLRTRDSTQGRAPHRDEHRAGALPVCA
jgi:hypothetical protein